MTNETLRFYAENAQEYVSTPSTNVWLDSFISLMPSGARVLELGTGSGFDAKRMLDAGILVDATDGSAELAQEAEKLLGFPVRVMLFHELDADQAYDGIYACASLLHARRVQLPEIVGRIHKALKTDGYAWASFKGGDGEGHDKFGRYYNYLSRDELLDLWNGNGAWSNIDIQTWQGSGYDDMPTQWHAITAQRQ
ncbi:class I SAM-dependent methyltransferase [Pelagibacterium lentulum]|uniref:Methyltransferase n=1 Tax=Pelagibacterium lentulum TaxID=2029865 RepID=A0A916RIQ8_9HYPH|nr:class I SAM-dependent methyltransferase [Pelagibacterium lentulum]GGA57801.1 methyltransferase [Pelagibacterium lentulum]